VVWLFFIQITKSLFFQFYPFPSGEPIFSKFKNKNFPFKFKNDFLKFFHFKFSWWRKRNLFGPRLPNLLKKLPIYFYHKIVIYCMAPPDGSKRVFLFFSKGAVANRNVHYTVVCGSRKLA
jgi:hypothetical protein